MLWAPEGLSRLCVLLLLVEFFRCNHVPELRIVLVMGILHQRPVPQDRHPRVVVHCYSATFGLGPVQLQLARSAPLDGDVRAVEVPEDDGVKPTRRLRLFSSSDMSGMHTTRVEDECESVRVEDIV